MTRLDAVGIVVVVLFLTRELQYGTEAAAGGGERRFGRDRAGGLQLQVVRMKVWLAVEKTPLQSQSGDGGVAPAIPRKTQGRASVGANSVALSYQTAVISPVQSHPRPESPGLILQMGGLVEILIMIDTEDAVPLPRE